MIIYRLIRDACLFIIIGIFFTEDTMATKLIVVLLALAIYFAMNKYIDPVEKK
jgi:Na+/H+ antiporter NhaA|tara:strand:- start:1268 stop:1426 length:159 start_codon:yes stop_codon:yes gene_type:complete